MQPLFFNHDKRAIYFRRYCTEIENMEVETRQNIFDINRTPGQQKFHLNKTFIASFTLSPQRMLMI